MVARLLLITRLLHEYRMSFVWDGGAWGALAACNRDVSYTFSLGYESFTLPHCYGYVVLAEQMFAGVLPFPPPLHSSAVFQRSGSFGQGSQTRLVDVEDADICK